jgi:hypothetical protein
MSSRKKFYCGDQDEIPDKYERRGSRVECLRRGVGVGMFLKEKEILEKIGIEKKKEIIRDESEEEREERFEREEEKFNKKQRRKQREEENEDDDIEEDEEIISDEREVYKKFVDIHFDKAKSSAKNLEIGDLFKQLAIFWKLEKKIKNKNKKNNF